MFYTCHLNDRLSFTLKQEVETSLENIIVKNRLIKLSIVFGLT